MQRVAIARALIHEPRLVLCDEPTGNLDPGRASGVLALLFEGIQRAGAIALLVTHSVTAATHADRILRLTPSGLEPIEPIHADAIPAQTTAAFAEAAVHQ